MANVVRYNIRDFEYDMIRLEAEELSGQGKNGGQTDVRILIAKLTALLQMCIRDRDKISAPVKSGVSPLSPRLQAMVPPVPSSRICFMRKVPPFLL